jgi:hypothetical protein
MRLDALALRMFHDVPRDAIERMVANAVEVLRTSRSNRAKIAASKVLLEAERVNLQALTVALQARHIEGTEWRPPAAGPECVIPDVDTRYMPIGVDDDTDRN